MMTKPLDQKHTLLLVALEKELPKKILPTWNIYYTGVGKVNAALSVVQAYNLYKPNVIINYGTVGSLNPKLSGLIKVNKLVKSKVILDFRNIFNRKKLSDMDFTYNSIGQK